MSPNPEPPYPRRDNGYVERWVYERDRQEDHRGHEVARREQREDAREIKEALDEMREEQRELRALVQPLVSLPAVVGGHGERLDEINSHADERSGMAKVGQMVLVVIPILIAIFMAALAVAASS